MTPEQYNGHALRIEESITDEHVTEMTKISQRVLGLPVDGRCGPITRKALVPFPAAPAPATMGEAVVAFAVTLIGQGEEGANNRGSFIERIGGKQGYEWCALSGGYAWRATIMRAGREPGSWWYRRKGVAEPGALNLIRALAGASKTGKFTDPALARPGDCAALDHGDGHGHFMLVERVDEDGIVHTLEGNVGRYPAKYKRLTRDVVREPRFWGFARPPEAE